jgi:Icc-related predicted phosphoesterase
MKIFVFSDLHGSSSILERLVAKAADADLLLMAGDLTDFGGESEARALLELMGSLTKKLAIVGGNCDKRGARDLLNDQGLSVDGLARIVVGALVLGAGGGTRHTGITPYERREEELAEALDKGMNAAKPELGSGKPLIVVTHAPPRGSGADLRKSIHVGSTAFAEALERLRPALWVCGHIHESPCASYSGETLVLNPGPAREGRYAIACLEKTSSGAWRAEAELLSL